MRDNISSLMDGEFHPNEACHLIEHIWRDEEARETWATYHLIGDVLRGDVVHGAGVQSRIYEKLADEPTVLAPKRRTQWSPRLVRAGMAIAASVATLSVVVWMAKQDPNAHSQQFARNTPAPVEVSSSLAIQPANLNEYLLAHEEFLPSTAGYRRVASTNAVAPANGAANR